MTYPTQNPIVLPHDSIPNFAVTTTKMSAGSGNWDVAGTWSPSGVPSATDVVGIDSAHTVTIRTTDAVAKAVGIAGILVFDPTVDTKLIVQHLLVYGDPTSEYGELRQGTDASRVAADKTSRIIIKDTPLEATSVDPRQHGNGLLVMGRRTARAAVKTPYVQLAAEINATDTVIQLASAPSGWRVGDQVCIADTRQLVVGSTARGLGGHTWETRTISVIAGATITVSSAFTWDHHGGEHGAGAEATNPAEFMPHLANLTRNVSVESEDAATTRGHTMYLHRADIDTEYDRFHQLGRTTSQPLSSYFGLTNTGITSFFPDPTNHRIFVRFAGSNQMQPGDTVTTSGFTGAGMADVNGEWTLSYIDTNDWYLNNAALSPTGTWDGTSGFIEHLPANQIGRYARHWHHCYGLLATPSHGYQGRSVGYVIDDPYPAPTAGFLAESYSSLPASKWGDTVHGSSFLLFEDGVIHHYSGANMHFEDGNEYRNTVRRLLTMNSMGIDNERNRDGNSGTGIFMNGYSHIIQSCVSCGHLGFFGGIVSGTGYYYNASESQTLANTRHPLYQGANVSEGAEGVEWTGVIQRNVLLQEFSSNVAYGAMATGMTIWFYQTAGSETGATANEVRTLSSFKAWNCYEEAFFGYPIANLHFINFVARGNPTLNVLSSAYDNGDYDHIDVTITGADWRGMKLGLWGSQNNQGTFTIEDSVIRTRETGLTVRTSSTPGAGGGNSDHRWRFDRCMVTHYPSADSFTALFAWYTTIYAESDLLCEDFITVTDWNGTGLNYEVYYYEQAADFVLPAYGGNVVVGSPEPGLTNAQLYVKYHKDGTLKDPVGSLGDVEGAALGGRVAPDTAVDGSSIGIAGLVSAFSSVENAILQVGSESMILGGGSW